MTPTTPATTMVLTITDFDREVLRLLSEGQHYGNGLIGLMSARGWWLVMQRIGTSLGRLEQRGYIVSYDSGKIQKKKYMISSAGRALVECQPAPSRTTA